jgi:hypothetical protein
MKRNLNRIRHDSSTPFPSSQIKAGPIMGYPLPPETVSRPQHKARPRRAGKRAFNGIRLVIMKDYRDRLAAVAHCMGCATRDLLYFIVIRGIQQCEANFLPELPPRGLDSLSRGQQSGLARKFEAVTCAVKYLRPEKN